MCIRDRMYINGESVASGNITVSMSSLASSAANYIAKSQYTSDPNYTGCIDEMEIYNDALTPVSYTHLY